MNETLDVLSIKMNKYACCSLHSAISKYFKLKPQSSPNITLRGCGWLKELQWEQDVVCAIGRPVASQCHHPPRHGSVVILDCHVCCLWRPLPHWPWWSKVASSRILTLRRYEAYRISIDAVSQPTGHLNTQWHCDLPSMVGALEILKHKLISGHLRSVALDIQKYWQRRILIHSYADTNYGKVICTCIH